MDAEINSNYKAILASEVLDLEGTSGNGRRPEVRMKAEIRQKGARRLVYISRLLPNYEINETYRESLRKMKIL